MHIRPETPEDATAIADVTTAAFEPMAYSDGSEVAIIRALRDAGDLTWSLVAEDAGEIVGHVAFSPVTIGGSDDVWFGLGPVSVAPDRQRRGVGRKLIETGLAELRRAGASGCVLVGDPGYYGQFGFIGDGPLTYLDVDKKFVQYLVLNGADPEGDRQWKVLSFFESSDEQEHPQR